jgi:hypothetical protein
MLAATQALADDTSGNNLYNACQQSPEFCFGVAAGLVVASWTPVRTALSCLPDGVLASQVGDVITKYLREHPEQRHHHSADVLAAAISDAWPCQGE